MPNTEIQEVSRLAIGLENYDIKDSTARIIINEIINAIGANNNNIAERINNLHDRSFDAEIKISSQNESEISNIIDGLYKVQYVTITGEGTEATETLNNSAILIQQGTNQYLIKDSQISNRTKTNNEWSSWESNNVKPDWEAASGSAAEILNKPTIATTVTQNDANPVSGSAVYGKFEDLIGAAPAALDTLGEIASALNNDADLAGTLTTQISNKVPKVSNPTPDNFASFNSDGTIKDSGVSSSSFITSIKTINNESIVGTGNIVVSGLPQVSASDNGKILMVVNGQWQLVSPSTLYSGNGAPNNAQGNNGDLYMQTD